MTDNFNLRTFLSENKLTKNAQLLKEQQQEGKNINEASDYGFDALMDAADDLYPEGTPENGKLVFAIEKALHANKIDTSEFGHDPSAASRAVQAIAGEIGLNETTNKMTVKERKLVKMVQEAMGMGEENVDYTMGRQDDPNQLPNPAPELTIPEGEDMVNEKPMPKYENIEKLMQEIDKSTDEAAHKYKMEEMKRVANMLEKKCTALEEGEDSDHIDQKKLKQMKKDIMTLRKGIEKMEKLGEKKFTKKQTKETKAELKEGFDLRKFLAENKLTTNSRMLNENTTQGPIKILQVLQNFNPGWISFEEFENQQGQDGYEDDEDGYNPSEGEWPVIGDEYDSIEEMREEINYYNEEVGRDSEIVAVKTTVGDFKF